MTKFSSLIGAKCNLCLEIATLLLLVIFLLLMLSKYYISKRKYLIHKNIQILLTFLFIIYIFLFEYEILNNGGIFKMVSLSEYYGSYFLVFLIYLHTAFYMGTFFLWIVLVIYSLKRIGKSGHNFQFSNTHRFAAKLSMTFMPIVSVLGLFLYYFGFYK